jgi:hypothetical protein
VKTLFKNSVNKRKKIQQQKTIFLGNGRPGQPLKFRISWDKKIDACH